MKRLLLIPIDFYRKRLSGAKSSPCCRFTPSCSNYAYHAVNEWGLIIGFFLSVFRILRCNPLFKGGRDCVPRIRRKLVPKTKLFKAKGRKAYVEYEKNYPYLSYYEKYLTSNFLCDNE